MKISNKKIIAAYQRNEAAYKAWAENQKLFNQRLKERYYYRKGVNQERRRKLAEKLLSDFPKASFRDTCLQIGGCREIIWSFGLWETEHDPYWREDAAKWAVYDVLRKSPDDIYAAMDDCAGWLENVCWSIIGHDFGLMEVSTFISEILDDIGAGKI